MASTSTLVADAVMTAFGGGGSSPEREMLRNMAAIAYSDYLVARAPITAGELADKAVSIGQGIATHLSYPGEVVNVTTGKFAPAVRTALVTGFRSPGGLS